MMTMGTPGPALPRSSKASAGVQLTGDSAAAQNEKVAETLRAMLGIKQQPPTLGKLAFPKQMVEDEGDTVQEETPERFLVMGDDNELAHDLAGSDMDSESNGYDGPDQPILLNMTVQTITLPKKPTKKRGVKAKATAASASAAASMNNVLNANEAPLSLGEVKNYSVGVPFTSMEEYYNLVQQVLPDKLAEIEAVERAESNAQKPFAFLPAILVHKAGLNPEKDFPENNKRVMFTTKNSGSYEAACESRLPEWVRVMIDGAFNKHGRPCLVGMRKRPNQVKGEIWFDSGSDLMQTHQQDQAKDDIAAAFSVVDSSVKFQFLANLSKPC